MPRLARIVAARLPHHVTQRGNRRQQTFFREGDYLCYKSLLAEHARAPGVAVWAWCLMPNHFHLILVPDTARGLTDCLRESPQFPQFAVSCPRNCTSIRPPAAAQGSFFFEPFKAALPKNQTRGPLPPPGSAG